MAWEILLITSFENNLVVSFLQYQESFPMGQLTKISGIPIVTFEQQKELGLCGIVFNPLDDSMVFLETPTEIRVSNTLWHVG